MINEVGALLGDFYREDAGIFDGGVLDVCSMVS